jgi:alginate O-acetyltransferase complex protein AlgI
MSVQSAAFAGAFTLLLLIHASLPPRWQRGLLLLSSLGFIASGGWPGLVLLLLVIFCCWLGGLLIEAQPQRPGLVFGLSAGLVLAPLLLARLPGALGEVVTAGLPAPIGLSFFTLQAFAYLQDIRRGDLQARRSLLDVALLISFFPKLASGPLERPADLLEQLDQPRPRLPAHLEAALLLLLWGFFKKLVLADNLAPIADKVYALRDPTFPLMLGGSTAYLLQVYADFSGWTDIARGLALLLGIRLSENFRAPYLSTSLTEFWRRWHMSFMSFLRDRVYLPLAGSRPTASRAAISLVATFLLSGLWHGASLNYLLWGLYNGLIVAMERGWSRYPKPAWAAGKIWTVVRVLWTLFLVDVGFVIFRETGGLPWIGWELSSWTKAAPPADWLLGRYLLALCLLYGAPLLGWDLFRALIERDGALPPWTGRFVPRLLVAALLLVACLTFAADRPASFVYATF